VIAFGCAVSDAEVFDGIGSRSIRANSEAGSVVLTRHGYDSIQHPYDEILDEAAGFEDLEGLVLIHQDLELSDRSLLSRVRPLLREPAVGIVGILGARGAPPHCWWETEDLYGRACTPLLEVHHSVGPHEVEVVDGALLVLAPWVVRGFRFSPELARDFHGYDVDLCLQVRAAGGRVVCEDVPYMHHMRKPWADEEQYMRAGRALARKWGRNLDPRERIPSFAP
jgi:Glycosyltransferase like family